MPRSKSRVLVSPRIIPGIGLCFALCDLEVLAQTSRKRTSHWHKQMGLPVQNGPRQMKVVTTNDLWQWVQRKEDPWSHAVRRLRAALDDLKSRGVIDGLEHED